MITKDEIELLLFLQERQAIALEKIVQLLQHSLPRSSPPGYVASLEGFANYDWASIGAKVELEDNYGVAAVSWQGQIYKRRSPDNVYGPVIFFSRAVKKDNGTSEYEQLIIFKPLKDMEVQPISRKVEHFIK